MGNDLLTHNVETSCNVKTKNGGVNFNTLMFTSRSGYLQNGKKK